MPARPLARPFAALRAGAAHAAAVAAPPYDVVSTEEARALVAGRPLSFLHISRPEIDLPEGSSPYSDEAYAQAARSLERLVADGVLVREAQPAFYVYRMVMAGRAQTGIAFVASVRAYEEQRIRRHELTRPDKETDRVRNIQALNAQTGPVLLAHRAHARLRSLVAAATRTPPLFAISGPNDVEHTVWRVTATRDVAELAAELDSLDALYIADGHHRAAAAARVATERRSASEASHEYFLAVAFPHDELRILPYNRVVQDLNGLSAAELLDGLRRSFVVTERSNGRTPPQPRTFGMYLAGRWHELVLDAALVPDDPVASLDVSLLQDRLLEPLLGIGDPRTDARIAFVGGVRGLEELTRLVDSGRAAVAFALHPTSMEQLMAVADAGLLMPPKSTWFEPKLADGLLTHVLD